MSEAPGPPHREAPPAGEELHLPAPSLLPFVSAIAITLIVIGTTINWIFTGIGAIVLIVCVVRWIGDTRRDVSELPQAHR